MASACRKIAGAQSQDNQDLNLSRADWADAILAEATKRPPPGAVSSVDLATRHRARNPGVSVDGATKIVRRIMDARVASGQLCAGMFRLDNGRSVWHYWPATKK